MKKYLIFICIIFGQTLSAQKFQKFYVEPLAFSKISYVSKSVLGPNLVSPNLIVNPRNSIWPLGFHIGLRVGYMFNDDSKLSFAVTQDQSLSGLYAHGLSAISFTPTVLLSNVRIGDFGGSSHTNVNLQYKRNLITIKSSSDKPEKFIKMYVNFGLGYFYKPNNGVENLTGIFTDRFLTKDSTSVTLEVTQWNSPESVFRSFRLINGIELCFGKGEREYFSVSFDYYYCDSRVSTLSYTHVLVTEQKGNNKSQYSAYYKSSGNGFYFTLSKRIYPFKIMNTRRKMRDKVHSN